MTNQFVSKWILVGSMPNRINPSSVARPLDGDENDIVTDNNGGLKCNGYSDAQRNHFQHRRPRHFVLFVYKANVTEALNQ